MPSAAESESNDLDSRAGRAIRAFVDNPVTNLVKGLLLLFIGLSEATRTFKEDLATGRLRVGHGLIVIGLFSVLDALPHFLDGLEATLRYLESTGPRADREGSPGPHPGGPSPAPGADDAEPPG